MTLGGMVAADVHGGNHHVDGCFGRHVTAITLRVADGRILTCSRSEYPDLFFATIGGMGLTGHILQVSFRLVRVPLAVDLSGDDSRSHIDAFMDALSESAAGWPMTKGWIDCLSSGTSLGRGVLFRGRWATERRGAGEVSDFGPQIPVPFMFPNGVLAPSPSARSTPRITTCRAPGWR